ncbi:MAG: ADP-forming succinate--CoA ligase subunit beta [Alphaproteobacteria bacterium CG_4_10_14_0_2_um_filter_63_37]|nr:MAG: succinate--CoA ligase subunit beta [Proteobacteria bacterium CG1_02_64_396]PJA25381.1 MAG: ADP-forming succinate--CoA ligase subunit beta [Alphaproteobacteria bacterium CG_4_10_14_0_2_um_filter_63_37]
MNIHEYQAKAVLAEYGVRVPRGYPAFSVTDAVNAAERLGGPVWVVKAQIHAGGRGKAGGVKVVKSTEAVAETAEKLLGATLVTHQTGPEGKLVQRLYVEEGADIARELYLGAVLDRATSSVVFMASTEGGMEIEEVAEHTPEKILREVVDPAIGLQGFQCRNLAFALGLEGKQINNFTKLMLGLYKAFVEKDAALVEINPLIVTGSGEIIALDAKMNFDDNALYRHADIEGLRDLSEEDPKETAAKQHDLNYVALDGNIGCMVNGAGLAMATMDIIQLYGAAPANFLDVGGGATAERVAEAFKIILSDPKVEGILVNIFGGIMRCDVIATGVIAAAREVNIQVPLVVRLEGTNVALGKKMMAESGLAIIAADDLNDAAQKVVAAVKGVQA